jgi:hypothetical protein
MTQKKKILKIGIIVIVVGILIGGSVGYYMFNQPHRDVQSIKADFQMESSELVKEYLADANSANEKYLQDEGESKILSVTGIIKNIDEDQNHQKVILLKSDTDKAGVSCTFTAETNTSTKDLTIGDKITVKGVIRSGASYDEDLELYEDVILEKCDIIKN